MFRRSGMLIGLIAASSFPSALASSTSEPLEESWSYTYYYRKPVLACLPVVRDTFVRSTARLQPSLD